MGSIADFRAEVRAWLTERLDGEFADVRGLGGSGREHEAIERRLEWERELGRGNWIGLGWPTEYGGRGLGLAEQIVFHEEYARAGGPGRLMHMSEQLVGPTLLAFGTEEQKRTFLPGIVSGEVLWCQGYSEPDAGSDLAGVRTRITRDGDEYVIDGQKIWTSLAHVAQWCFVLGRTGPDSSRHAGLSYVLVPMDQPGVEVRPIVQITGTSEFNEVFFDGARTSVANRVGAEGAGWAVAMATLGFERGVATLGQQIGFRRELDAVIERARRSGTIHDPELRDRIIRSWIGLEVMRHMATSTLRSAAAGTAGVEASLSKLQWGTWHRKLGEIAIDACGVEGLQVTGGDLSPEQTLFLFSRADTIYGGSNEIQRNIIAERLLGLPKG